MSITVVRAVDGLRPAAGHLRVGAAQYGVTTDVEANLAIALRFVAAAAAEGVETLVLPEFGNHVSWYTDREHARRMAVTLDGPYVAALAAAAAEHGLWLMANCVVAQADGRTTGTNLLFSPEGTLVATSDKQVLMGSERLHLDPALENGPIVETPVARFGMYSCMDGVINETPRGLAVRGAQVLLNSLNSFALDEASLHIPVRAPENRVWVVAANKVGPLAPPEAMEQVSKGVGVPAERLHGAGESQVVAPDGTVVAMGPRTGEALVVADIDVTLADDKRRPDGTDVMTARRPELYSALAGEPKGRIAPPGAEETVVAVVVPSTEGADALEDAARQVREAVASGAELIVLPELYCFEGGILDPALDAEEIEQRTHLAVATLVDALHGSAALVVTSLPGELGEGVSHDGVLLSAEGVVARQPQLHHVERHAHWVTALGQALTVHAVPFGRLAIVVGDDSLYPETFRLAALADADVVAAPVTVLESWETTTGLVERSGENRLVVVAATRPGPGGASIVCDLPHDFTLWSPHWSAPFAGVISHPVVRAADSSSGPVLVTVHPAEAVNRMVSRGTDLVDGRPWELLGGTLTAS